MAPAPSYPTTPLHPRSKLLALSAELRIRIYAYALSSDASDDERRMGIKVDTSSINTCVNLLCVNRQIHEESIRPFFDRMLEIEQDLQAAYDWRQVKLEETNDEISKLGPSPELRLSMDCQQSYLAWFKATLAKYRKWQSRIVRNMKEEGFLVDQWRKTKSGLGVSEPTAYERRLMLSFSAW